MPIQIPEAETVKNVYEGELFDANDQCKMIFGQDSRFYLLV